MLLIGRYQIIMKKLEYTTTMRVYQNGYQENGLLNLKQLKCMLQYMN